MGGEKLKSIIEEVENLLAGFYGFVPVAHAFDHLASKSDLAESLGAESSLPEFSSRGGVWLISEEDIYIGIHFDDEIVKTLETHDPLIHLGDENLDAFCVLIEEVSHFHMLLNRISANQGISKLDLELQGEVDKVLVSALLLQQQCGDAHILPLARKIFDLAKIDAKDEKLYWRATRLAARFWYEIIDDNSSSILGSSKLRRSLKRGYYQGSSSAA